jgi:hypothetical protein
MSTPEDDTELALRNAVDEAEAARDAAHLRLQDARKALIAYRRGEPVPKVEGPEDGHTFRIRVESRMSSSVQGEEGHTDADWFDEHGTGVEVRAWDLPAALRKAAALPFAVWTAQ